MRNLHPVAAAAPTANPPPPPSLDEARSPLFLTSTFGVGRSAFGVFLRFSSLNLIRSVPGSLTATALLPSRDPDPPSMSPPRSLHSDSSLCQRSGLAGRLDSLSAHFALRYPSRLRSLCRSPHSLHSDPCHAVVRQPAGEGGSVFYFPLCRWSVDQRHQPFRPLQIVSAYRCSHRSTLALPVFDSTLDVGRWTLDVFFRLSGARLSVNARD
jgi:hypothetical protein